MEIRKRNIILLVAVVVMVILNVSLMLYEPSSSRLSFEPDHFAVADTSSIASIRIDNEKGSLLFQRSNGFQINDKYEIDQSMLQLFFAVLDRVRISKTVSLSDSTKRANVVITMLNRDQKSFQVQGDPNLTRTFFIDDSGSYEVEIPGYRDYLGSLFTLDEDQWRDRVVMNGNWRTIQNLKAVHQQEGEIEIIFEDRFFRIPGVSELDSNRVVEYLNQFEFLTGNERIVPGKYPRFDSALTNEPELIIVIDDIKFKGTRQLTIYPPYKGDQYQVMEDANGEMIIFDQRFIEPLFRNKDFFRYQGS